MKSLPNERLQELKELASRSLDRAESIWGQVGTRLTAFSASNEKLATESIETQIPGYPSISPGKPEVDQFIALVADMRDSTKHLLCAISPKTAKVSQLQRIYYETSALLPCLAKVIAYESGSVTEYLGDGVLAIFRVSSDNRDESVYACNRASRHCINCLREVVNPCLRERYSLPDLSIGVGMSYGQALVTSVGLPEYQLPKVFGRCVFNASKLSGGKDEIIVDDALKNIWPTSEGGTLRFTERKFKDVNGYLVTND